MKRQTLSVLVAVLLTLVVMNAGCGNLFDKPVGMVVIYEVDADRASNAYKPSERDTQMLLAVIDQRLNPGGRKLGLVRQLDDGRIEVSIFRADLEEMQRIADFLPKPGTLEFRVLANSRDHADLIEAAKATEGRNVFLPDDDKKPVARWIPVQDGREDEFALLKDIATRERSDASKTTLEILVAIDPYNVTGEYLDSCSTGYDDRIRPCVNFLLSHKGGLRFAGLTAENLPDDIGDYKRHLGIILDGTLYSAPYINGQISTRGQITGDFTEQEVRDLVDLLNVGSLPAPIRKVEQRLVEDH